MQTKLPAFEALLPTQHPVITRIHPDVTSVALGWPNLQVDHFSDMRSDGFELPGIAHHMLNVLLDANVEVDNSWDGRHYKGPHRTGDVCLTPAHRPARWRWRGHNRECLYIFLDPALLAHTAEAEWDCDPAGLDLIGNLHFTDPALLRLSLELRNELLNGGPGGRLLAESVGTMMAVHLLRRQSTVSPRFLPELHKGGLTPRQLRQVLECMEAHLAEDVTLARLAAVAGVSISHFGPAFRRTVGEPPHRYLMRRRAERAQALMLRGKLSLAHVATACGFTDQSHMTRAFHRYLGTTPGAWRRERLSQPAPNAGAGGASPQFRSIGRECCDLSVVAVHACPEAIKQPRRRWASRSGASR